jgi:hypothetical protein
VRWRIAVVAMVGAIVVAGLGVAAPVGADPVVVLPQGATELPAELPASRSIPAPSPETVRARDALAEAVAAPAALGSVTVSPGSGLVHGQDVTVHGEGWPAGDEVTVLQCGPNPLDPDDCEPAVLDEGDIGRVGAGGAVTRHFVAEVVLDTLEGPIDCRVVTCRIGLLDLWTGRLRLRTVGFDPGGPDPTRPTVAVTPDTGLVDGDLLDVTASGVHEEVPGFNLAQLVPCRTPVTSVDDCDQSQRELAEIDRNGDVAGRVWASPILDVFDRPYDCRTGTCALLVGPLSLGFDELGELSEVGLHDLAFDPLAPLQPPPTLTADPDSGLRDGDVVDLHGSGFDAERGFTVAQCAADATSAAGCQSGIVRFGVTDGSEITGSFVVLAKFLDGRGRTVDCRVQDCVVVVAHGDFGRHARAALDFDPDAPLLEPSITVTPSTGLHDGDVVTVAGTGWPHDQPILIGQCPAGTRDVFFCDISDDGFVWPESVAVPLARTRAAAEASTGFEIEVPVRTTAYGPDGPVDCRVEPCELLASDDPGLRQARVPLVFGEAVAGPVSASPTFTG